MEFKYRFRSLLGISCNLLDSNIVDVSSALFTLSLSILALFSQCKEGAGYVIFISFGNVRIFGVLKGSPYPSHFTFEINVGKGRIRHTTILNLKLQSILSQSRNSEFNFKVVVCRIRLFPTLISKINWLGSELPLRI